MYCDDSVNTINIFSNILSSYRLSTLRLIRFLLYLNISALFGNLLHYKLPGVVSELPEKDISNVVVQCRWFSTISCHVLYLSYLKTISQNVVSSVSSFTKKLLWQRLQRGKDTLKTSRLFRHRAIYDTELYFFEGNLEWPLWSFMNTLWSSVILNCV